MNQKTVKKIKKYLSRLKNGHDLFNSVRDRYNKLPSTARAVFLQKLDTQTQKKNPFST